jgi:hypothetical protein
MTLPLRGWPGENVLAESAVLLHAREFVARQLAGLQQNGVRNPDLPHVVQLRRLFQHVGLAFGQSERCGN